MNVTTHRGLTELEAGLDQVRQSPRDAGTLELIVGRPAEDERTVLAEAQLDVEEGLVGDNWATRPSSKTSDGAAHPDMQLNIMNARAATLVAGDAARRPLAGDQLYVDLDLSEANLPPGTQLALGEAVVEITAIPHRGCTKFKDRFGAEALKFVNSEIGCQLNLRGVNAKVIRSGTIRQGDAVRRI
ncbi:MAG: MOSC domain-containing protein [Planctomycetota bacterium]|nr:MAG: MOSC domain-containing protein [Planctomycetota bacterium]REJ87971.1 MAG: MOSC domain-containing protein [Planctomycetota bacterium]